MRFFKLSHLNLRRVVSSNGSGNQFLKIRNGGASESIWISLKTSLFSRIIYALWVIFMILYHNADMVMMEDEWLIWIERDYESFSRPKWNLSKDGCRDPWTVESVRIVKGDTRIHGRPIWSEFLRGWRDPRTADLVRFLKEVCRESLPGINGRPIWSESLKGNAGIHEPPNQTEF